VQIIALKLKQPNRIIYSVCVVLEVTIVMTVLLSACFDNSQENMMHACYVSCSAGLVHCTACSILSCLNGVNKWAYI